MNNIFPIEPENLSLIFKKYLPDPNVIFVFSTDVVMNSWIDWCVVNPEISGVDAVPLERFTAWDKFKSSFATSSQKGKTAIPAVLRKVFVNNLLRQNALNPFFKKIINPSFAKDAYSFTDWISKMLPSLQLWHEKSEILDEEDEDYNELYKRYCAFLEENQFFEPSWLKPEFVTIDKTFVIFYPEILEDYADYIEIFKNNENIHLITLPEDSATTNKAVCYKYSDSRRELRRTILQIRKLVAEKKADWNEITLNVPDLETYTPYLERELEKYCVPYVIRAGYPLTKNCAGQIFQEIYECYNTDFSYDSLRKLLLDEYVPWSEKNEKSGNVKQLKTSLIRAGNELHCLCGYEEISTNRKVDIWEKALNFPPYSESELPFYRALKNDITRICEAASFSGVYEAWIIFRNNFLEENNFSDSANKIISRCITELKELVRIEEDFFEKTEISINNSYKFFLEHISGKKYTMQNNATGISVYPYRLSAAANFKYQFVIDASQKNLEIQFKRLSFLSSQKRIKLGLDKEDRLFNPATAFIRLYNKIQDKSVIQFSYAESTFSGFAIMHNGLQSYDDKDENPLKELDSTDFIVNEEKLFLSDQKNSAITEAQKNQYEFWRKITGNRVEIQTENIKRIIQEKINFVLIENRSKHLESKDGKKISVTQSDMKTFFPCPRKWFFGNVLSLKEDSLDTSLMDYFEMGNIHHRIIEFFLKDRIQNHNKKLPVANPDFENEEEIVNKVFEITDFVINEDSKMNFRNSPLTVLTLDSQKSLIAAQIIFFLKNFCKPQEEKGFGECTVLQTEGWHSAENEKLRYSGKMDCVLTDDNDNIFIIDFKDSTPPSKTSCYVQEDGSLGDFQIPMYLNMWNKNPENKVKANAALFYTIKDAKKSVIVQPHELKNKEKSQSIEEFQSTIERFEEFAESFIEKVKTENLNPTENEDPYFKIEPFTDCKSCGYKTICRTAFNIEQRKLKN